MKWTKFNRDKEYVKGIYAVEFKDGSSGVHFLSDPRNELLPQAEYICKLDSEEVLSQITGPDEELELPEGWGCTYDRDYGNRRLMSVSKIDGGGSVDVYLGTRNECVRFINAGFKALEKKG